MDRQTITLAQSLENEVSESNSLVNDIYYQNIKKYDCENVQFKTVMTQKISNESNRIYSISLYDMNGNRVWVLENHPVVSILNNHGLKMRKRILKPFNMVIDTW